MTGGSQSRFDVSELHQLARDAGLAAAEHVQLLKAALARASGAGMAEAREKAPAFTGELAGSIVVRGVQIEERGSSIRLDDLISTTVDHSIVQEEGRRPGARWPPIGPIARWVQLMVRRGKLDVSWTEREDEKQAIYVAALFIAATISRRGLPGRRFMAAGAAVAETVLVAECELVAEQLRRRIELQ